MLLYGRVTYEWIEDVWRRQESEEWPDRMDAGEVGAAVLSHLA